MLSKGIKIPKAKTTEQALASLVRLCARAEKSSGDALRLMSRWGVEERERATVLQKLIEHKFIDDSRYAEAFVREKVRLNGWGVRKIGAALRVKGISSSTITTALQQADSSTMDRRLEEQLAKKIKSVKYSNQYELKGKLVRYGLSLGYDYDKVDSSVSELVGNYQTSFD